MRARSTTWALFAALTLTGACSTVHEVEDALIEDRRPPVETVDNETRGVTVPDLDERKEDEASLSQVDRLQREIRRLGQALAMAEKERDDSVGERNRALEAERELVQQNIDYQELLKICKANEDKLKSQVLQAQIENVRLKQELANQRIRELSAGAGEK
ncbi:MAG: hypothetical protein H6807_13865 [Planctomycetes bacterium]|nr:hypothetical protein [Planctomycetota bacterium]